jgi:hypothetical protein
LGGYSTNFLKTSSGHFKLGGKGLFMRARILVMVKSLHFRLVYTVAKIALS